MRSNRMNSALSAIVVIGLHVFPAAAQAETLKGKLVELSSVDDRVTLRLEGADTRVASAQVSDDARWHICLKESCVIRKGVEGFRTVNEYAQYGAYGISRQAYGVTLKIRNKVATALEVQLVPNVP